MASFRMLTHSTCSHLLPRHSFRTQIRDFAIAHSCTPAIRAPISVTARKTVPAIAHQINLLGNSTARPSRSLYFNVSSSFQFPFQCRRLLHNGQRPSFFDRRPSFLPWTIIVVCGSCFVYSIWARAQLENHGNVAPLKSIRRNFISSLTNYREGRWWTLLTPTVMHLMPLHLLINMYCFLGFGTSVVQLLGARPLLVTWVGAGVFSSVASLIHEKWKETKAAKKKSDGFSRKDESESDKSRGGLGASGSILGMFALLTCMVPNMPMQIMMIPVSIPAWRLLAGGAVFSLAALQFGWLPGFGHDAHLGGMLFGVLYFVFLRTRGKGGLKSLIAMKFLR